MLPDARLSRPVARCLPSSAHAKARIEPDWIRRREDRARARRHVRPRRPASVAARGDSCRGRRPRCLGGAADRRRQVAVLPAAAARHRQADGRRLAAHRVDEGPTRWPPAARLSGGRSARQPHARREARAVARTAGRLTAVVVRGTGAVVPRRLRVAVDVPRHRRVRNRRGALHKPVGPRFPA